MRREGLGDQQVIEYPWLSEDPALVDEIGKFDLASIEPAIVRPHGHNKLVLEQCPDIYFIWNLLTAEIAVAPSDYQVDLAVKKKR